MYVLVIMSWIGHQSLISKVWSYYIKGRLVLTLQLLWYYKKILAKLLPRLFPKLSHNYCLTCHVSLEELSTNKMKNVCVSVYLTKPSSFHSEDNTQHSISYIGRIHKLLVKSSSITSVLIVLKRYTLMWLSYGMLLVKFQEVSENHHTPHNYPELVFINVLVHRGECHNSTLKQLYHFLPTHNSSSFYHIPSILQNLWSSYVIFKTKKQNSNKLY
jgi:hypothetical protein